METYVVVDVETTGLSAAINEITEIGAIKVVDGRIVEILQALVKIDGYVPQHITKITGITNLMLQQEGYPREYVMGEFLKFVGELPLVAHNAPFDMAFINAGLARCGMRKLTNQAVDTVRLARSLHKGLASYKLGELARHFSITAKGIGVGRMQMHRSLGDCRITQLLYERLKKDMVV